MIDTAENVPLTLTNGATVTAPRGWTIETGARGVALRAPEGDLVVHVLPVPADGEAATLAARARATLSLPALPEKASGDEAARDGWQQVRTIVHDVPAARKAWAQSSVYRGEGLAVVIVQDGAMATFEKRLAACLLVTQSLRAPGFGPENLAGVTPRRFGAAEVAEIKRFLSESMRLLGVPGIGLGLATGDELLFEGGLGEREQGGGVPVTAGTRFQIASNTKSLTTLLLARLVDAGRLRWSDRVQDIYPGFRLADAAVAQQIEVRHLVSASTGLPRRDMVWGLTFRHDTPPEATFDLLAQSAPTTGFGEVYQYSNLMAAAAGWIAGHAAFPDLPISQSFDRALRAFILDPLEMTATTFDGHQARAGDFAAGHGSAIDGTPIARALDDGAIYALRPSGGAWATTHDLLSYARCELTTGKLPDGQQLVSVDSMLERRKPFVTIGENGAYGMGLSLDRSGGVLSIGHGGSLPGYMSDFAVFPDAGLAAVILTNADNGQYLLPGFRRRLLELLYGAAPKAEAQVQGWADRLKAERAMIAGAVRTPLSAETRARLAARYRSTELGELTIDAQADRTVATLGPWAVELGEKPGSADPVDLVTMDPLLRGLPLTLSGAAGCTRLALREGQYEYVYEEIAP